jgi:hypothetical protein
LAFSHARNRATIQYQDFRVTLKNPGSAVSALKGGNVKYLPVLALTVAMSACAAPMSPGVSQVGTSSQPPKAVAQCIAQKWADKSQQQVISQDTLANDMAADVYVPGQQPPSGAAAVVRPNYSGPGSWVGFRAAGAAGSDTTGDIQACL